MKHALTQKKIKVLCDAISKGVPKKYAALKAGIAESSFYYYIGIAEDLFNDDGKLIKKKKELTKREQNCVELLESVKKAEAEAVSRNVALIQTAAIDTWQAAAWWLERLHPNEFGRKDRVDLTAKGHLTYEEIMKKQKDDRGAGEKNEKEKNLNLSAKVSEIDSVVVSVKKKSFLKSIKESE